MTAMTIPGLFITGTDTEVGKTYVAARIAAELASQGHRVGVYKPVASGCRREGSQCIADDAVQLWQAAGRPGQLHDVCPQCFQAPLAPHLAARAEGRCVDDALLRSGIKPWLSTSDIVIVEGVGGLMSPVSDDSFVADLAYEFGWRLVVVARNTLGVINQTLQTLITAATFRDGIDVAGVVLNEPCEPDPRDASTASNLAELKRCCVPPVLGQMAWQGVGFQPAVDWRALAQPAAQ